MAAGTWTTQVFAQRNTISESKKEGKKTNSKIRKKPKTRAKKWLAPRADPPKKKLYEIKRATKWVDKACRQIQPLVIPGNPGTLEPRGKRCQKTPRTTPKKGRTWPQNGMGDTREKQSQARKSWPKNCREQRLKSLLARRRNAKIPMRLVTGVPSRQLLSTGPPKKRKRKKYSPWPEIKDSQRFRP